MPAGAKKVPRCGAAMLLSTATKAWRKTPLKGDAFAPPLRIPQQNGKNRNSSVALRFLHFWYVAKPTLPGRHSVGGFYCGHPHVGAGYEVPAA